MRASCTVVPHRFQQILDKLRSVPHRFSVCPNERYPRVFLCQLRQHFLVRTVACLGLLQRFETPLVEQQPTQFRRGCENVRRSPVLFELFQRLSRFRFELSVELFQCLAVDGNPRHVRKPDVEKRRGLDLGCSQALGFFGQHVVERLG